MYGTSFTPLHGFSRFDVSLVIHEVIIFEDLKPKVNFCEADVLEEPEIYTRQIRKGIRCKCWRKFPYLKYCFYD